MNKTFQPGLQIGLLAAMLTLSTAAFAHPGHETMMGFASGLSHPFFGLDHLVAMIALGFVAVKLHARRLTFASFSTGMVLGGILAAMDIAIPYVEAIIVASLLAIAYTLFNRTAGSARPVYAVPAIVIFAAGHGWAHVAEQPVELSSAGYMAGMMLGAICLQAIGLMLSQRLRQKVAAERAVAGTSLVAAVMAATSLLLG